MGTICSSIFNKSYVHFRITDKIVSHPSLQQLMVIQDDITGNLVYGISVNVDSLDIKDKPMLERHQLLTHGNILRFEGFKKINDKEYLALFQSFDCTLAEEIQARKAKNSHFSEQEILGILQNITAALAYFQNKDIYHGAVRPENIVKKDDEYKLLDLVLFEKHQTTYHQALEGNNSTNVRYLSPELQEALAKKVENPAFKKYKQDIYSLGMIILDAMTLNNESQLSLKLKLSFQYYSESLVEVVTKMIQENELFRLDAVSCNKIIESIYYGFPVADEPDQTTLISTYNNQTNSIASEYDEFEASPKMKARSPQKVVGPIRDTNDISASNVRFKTDVTMAKESLMNTDFSVENLPGRPKAANFLQSVGDSIETLKGGQFFENKASAILHVPQSTFGISKDEWQFQAFSKDFKNLDPLYNESIELNQGIADSILESQLYTHLSPNNKIAGHEKTVITQGATNDSKISTEYAPNYNTLDLLSTYKPEEKVGSSNMRTDGLDPKITAFTQSPNQVQKSGLFSPLGLSPQSQQIAGRYMRKVYNNQSPNTKDYFSNTTFGTQAANSVEQLAQKTKDTVGYDITDFSDKKSKENLTYDPHNVYQLDSINFKQPGPNGSSFVSNPQAKEVKTLFDNNESLSPYLRAPYMAQKTNYREPSIMTIDEYRAHDFQTFEIKDDIASYQTNFTTDKNSEIVGESMEVRRLIGKGKDYSTQSHSNFKNISDQDEIQNYKKHYRTKTLMTSLGGRTDELIANKNRPDSNLKHKISASEYVSKSVEFSGLDVLGSDKKRFRDGNRQKYSMFSDRSQPQLSSFSKAKSAVISSERTLGYALEHLRNEMKHSFFSEADNFLTKRLAGNKKRQNSVLETIKSDIQKIKGAKSIDNTNFSMIIDENQEKLGSAMRPTKFHKRSLTTSYYVENPLANPQKSIKVYEDGLKYEGELQGELRHGQGRLTFKDGSFYEGSWKLDRMDGYGVLFSPTGNIAYEGEWRNNRFEGSGACYNERPVQLFESYTNRPFNEADKTWVKYEGEFNSHKWNGFGKLTLSNGDVFQGNFRMGVIHGRGNYTTNDGYIIAGEWANNRIMQAF